MDCTYKVNRYNMPMLNVVGVTATYETFNAGFVLLSGETEKEYVWALEAFSTVVRPALVVTDRELALINAISTAWPGTVNILCTWHVNKTVLATFSKLAWGGGGACDKCLAEWNNVLYCVTEESFQAKWTAFREKWTALQPSAVDYVTQSWMAHKEKVARCWTNR